MSGRRVTARQVEYLRAFGSRQATASEIAARVHVGREAAYKMLRGLRRARLVEGVMTRRRTSEVRMQLTAEGMMTVLTANARAFGGEMKAQGIHVGVGSPPICVVCEIAWPCNAAQPDGLACLADDAATGH